MSKMTNHQYMQIETTIAWKVVAERKFRVMLVRM